MFIFFGGLFFLLAKMGFVCLFPYKNCNLILIFFKY